MTVKEANMIVLALKGTVVNSVRIRIPGGICTQDFHIDRLNIHVNDRGEVEMVSLG